MRCGAWEIDWSEVSECARRIVAGSGFWLERPRSNESESACGCGSGSSRGGQRAAAPLSEIHAIEDVPAWIAEVIRPSHPVGAVPGLVVAAHLVLVQVADGDLVRGI